MVHLVLISSVIKQRRKRETTMVLVDVDEFPVALAQSEFPDLLSEAKTPRHGTPPSLIGVPAEEDALLDKLLDDGLDEKEEIPKSRAKFRSRPFEEEKKEDDIYMSRRRQKEDDKYVNEKRGDSNRRQQRGEADFNGRSKSSFSKTRESKRAQLFHVESRDLEKVEPPAAATHYNSEKSVSSDDTSSTSESGDSPQDNVGMEEFLMYENGGTGPKDGSTSASEESVESDNTDDLLSRAHERICLQTLQEEILSLQRLVDKKNVDIERLSGQLRRAVATKCDLVLAHTELERSHEHNMKIQEDEVKELHKANFNHIEFRAEIEKVCAKPELISCQQRTVISLNLSLICFQEFMNEIAKLTEDIKDLEEKHREELEDWERLHRNEMLEKDFQIAQLSEELRKATGKPVLHSVQRKKGLTAIFKKQ